MLKVLRSLFTLALLLSAGVALAAAEVKPYARDDLASDVVRLTDTLRKETAQIGARLKGKSVEQLRKDAASEVAKGNYKDAGGWLGAEGDLLAVGERAGALDHGGDERVQRDLFAAQLHLADAVRPGLLCD